MRDMSVVKTIPSERTGVRDTTDESLGYRLRYARRKRGATLKEVADAAGCSESLLSKLENNKAHASVNLLRRVCGALDLTMGELFANAEEPGDVVTRAGERKVVDFDPVRPGYRTHMERLIPLTENSVLQGNIHILAPGGGSEGMISHAGEEVGYLISGEIELLVGGRIYRMSAGDSFFFRSELPHGYRNVGEEEARVIFINTPPTF